MDPYILRQLRGAAALLTSAVTATTKEIEVAHHAIARWPYACLSWLPGVALPARLLGRVQHALTRSIYGGIRLMNRLIGAAVACALERLERRSAAGEA